MQSSEISNSTDICRKAEIYDALSIMLQEAGSRGNTHEAAYVVSGVLENLTQDYPELKGLAQQWTSLALIDSKIKGAA